MKIVFILTALVYALDLQATQIVLKDDGKYRILSSIHLVNDVPYKEGTYQALIEIPAGSTAKWEVDHNTGHLEWEFRDSKPRNVKFLGYPGNYGFIPQTILDKSDGGDGDPLDIIVLGPSVKQGSIQKVRIIGAIKLLDSGEQDDKIIAIPLESPFEKIESIGEMMVEFPGVIEIVRYWFEGYKGSKMQFMGYMEQAQAQALVEKAHTSWSKHKNDH